MEVRCLNNCRGNLDLTVGKEYKVIREEILMGEKAYVVMNDYNIPNPYFLKRFEIIKESKEMKEVKLQEVFGYPEETEFKFGFKEWGEDKYITFKIHKEDLWYDNWNTISDLYTLKDILEGKFFLVDNWKEISFFEAYTSNEEVKYVNGNVEIIGTHYGILSKLDSECKNTNKNLIELISTAKWYVKED